jgi:hypothetical protein
VAARAAPGRSARAGAIPDLDAITAAAQAARAKVVLVGDPAQIGVVEGPGGLLGALADRVGAAQLNGVHRFTQPWERAASLAQRRGNPAVLNVYLAQGRIHPAASHDAALDAVFAHWARARAAGRDALMMAHARADVDRPNERARAAALADGTITGPEIRIGTATWQAGDLLRTRRNNRNLPLGTCYVHNGDRFRVLGGPAPTADCSSKSSLAAAAHRCPPTTSPGTPSAAGTPPSTPPKAAPPTSASCWSAPAWTVNTSTSA